MDVSQFWRMMKRPGHGTKCTLSTFVHERGCHPEFRMGDGAPAITKAGEELFADCDQCEDSLRLICAGAMFIMLSTNQVSSNISDQ